MNSPALLPRHLDKGSLELDSCLAFKMNASPLLTGKLDHIEGGGEQGSLFLMHTPVQKGRVLSKFG